MLKFNKHIIYPNKKDSFEISDEFVCRVVIGAAVILLGSMLGYIFLLKWFIDIVKK